jgi:hypothetical protein
MPVRGNYRAVQDDLGFVGRVRLRPIILPSLVSNGPAVAANGRHLSTPHFSRALPPFQYYYYIHVFFPHSPVPLYFIASYDTITSNSYVHIKAEPKTNNNSVFPLTKSTEKLLILNHFPPLSSA